MYVPMYIHMAYIFAYKNTHIVGAVPSASVVNFSSNSNSTTLLCEIVETITPSATLTINNRQPAVNIIRLKTLVATAGITKKSKNNQPQHKQQM